MAGHCLTQRTADTPLADGSPYKHRTQSYQIVTFYIIIKLVYFSGDVIG